MSQLVQASNVSQNMPNISKGHQANYLEALQCCLDQKHELRVNEVIMELADRPYQCSIYLRLQWCKAKLIH